MITVKRPCWIVFLVVWGILAVGCGQLADRRSYAQEDLSPPMLMEVYSRSNRAVVLEFDEPVKSLAGVSITPELGFSEPVISGMEVVLPCEKDMAPGTKYAVEGTVEDHRENTMTFLYPFYGYNPTPPQIVINEVTPQGSSSRPDMVELHVKTGGNMAGICFTEGTSDIWSGRLIFPEFLVSAGEYILIHCRPEGIPEEVDEVEDSDSSGGRHVHAEARDFWLPDGDGLSGNNGVLALYSYPGGPIIDGFMYSNRTSQSDDKYRGFGSRKMMEMVDQLYLQGGWSGIGEMLAPEDAVDPEDSTATRSICRSPDGGDTDSKDDWFIVATGEASFGEKNSNVYYSVHNSP